MDLLSNYISNNNLYQIIFKRYLQKIRKNNKIAFFNCSFWNVLLRNDYDRATKHGDLKGKDVFEFDFLVGPVNVG